MAAAKFSLAATSEKEIYAHLGMQWVTPELREDTGEVIAGELNQLPNLIEMSDIRGSLHNHTTLSDGEAS